ncbi:MAG: glycerol-3-phosphate acyltransferase [Anaerolineae bacterium]
MAIPLVIAAVGGYFLGSVPFGVLFCRLSGKDPRTVGSGRTGGTNVYRTAGLPPALATVAADIAKGSLAVWSAPRLAAGGGASDAALVASVAALAVILGHNYSVFLHFTGGAGSSPNIGAALVLDPILGASALVVSAAVLFMAGVASIASLTLATILLAGIVWLVTAAASPPALLLYGAGQFLLLAWALRPNLVRLLHGTERRVAFRRPPGEHTGGA